MKKLTRIHSHIKPSQLKALQDLSDKTGAPVAELIRRAIMKFLEENTNDSDK